MAQRPITEYFGKKLLYHFLPGIFRNQNFKYAGFVVNSDNIDKLKFPLFREGYVAKPDELFGKRGKNNLVFVSTEVSKVKNWLKEKMSKPVTIFRNKKDKGITGMLDNFLVEPYYQHKQEYYLAIKSERYTNKVYFSNQGGIDIEENWQQVNELEIPFTLEPQPLSTTELKRIEGFVKNPQDKKLIAKFVSALQQVFTKLDFAYLEINPFIIKNGQIILLDLVARLDDTALYKNQALWEQGGTVFFPSVFGSSRTAAEQAIKTLDEKSGASLKFTLLNPNGRIWLLTSGGGGSVIFSDTVADLGYQNEIANYGEYSGNPSSDETYAYTKIVLSELIKAKTRNKLLLIAGGIANFTDIRNTFIGIVKALKGFGKELKRQKVKIFVRRGGPNYQAGLAYIKEEINKLGIPIQVHGPEMYMTEIIELALKN